MAAPRFLFVHGAWHGAWSFDLLRLELERRAVPCEAIDLPAMGDDTTPIAEATFEEGVERVVARIGTRRNWTLVGHSLGGMYVTEAAMRASGKVRGVVYLAAYVPLVGDDWRKMDELAPSSADFKSSLRKDETAGTLTFDPARAKNFFYHDVAAGIAAAAVTRLKPQPIEPFERAKIEGNAEQLKKVPRSAIVGDDDRVLKTDDLVALAKRAQIPVETVESGHCPFLSVHKRLADLLLGVK